MAEMLEHMSEYLYDFNKFIFASIRCTIPNFQTCKWFCCSLYMLGKAIRVDQYVIQIDNDIDVYHIHEDVVHELLKSCGSISKPFRHYQPLKGPISGLECGLPLIPSSDANQVVCMLKVDFSVDSCFSWCVQ